MHEIFPRGATTRNLRKDVYLLLTIRQLPIWDTPWFRNLLRSEVFHLYNDVQEPVKVLKKVILIAKS